MSMYNSCFRVKLKSNLDRKFAYIQTVQTTILTTGVDAAHVHRSVALYPQKPETMVLSVYIVQSVYNWWTISVQLVNNQWTINVQSLRPQFKLLDSYCAAHRPTFNAELYRLYVLGMICIMWSAHPDPKCCTFQIKEMLQLGPESNNRVHCYTGGQQTHCLHWSFQLVFVLHQFWSKINFNKVF